MKFLLTLLFAVPATTLAWAGSAQLTAAGGDAARTTVGQAAQGPSKAPERSKEGAAPSAGTSRGKKLMLKDGSFQIVRDYQKNGERVRYYSIERSAWEEIPDSLVDWDATKKAEVTDEKTRTAMLDKVRVQEAATKTEVPVDVDASLTVAPGVFLPDGEGMFVLADNRLKPLTQVGSDVKTDKKTVLKQIFTPIPIIASKRNVEIPGARSAVRLSTETPEFYLREVITNADDDSRLQRTGRQNPDGPDVMLMRVKVKGNKRVLESVRSYFGEKVGEERDEITLSRWEVAPNVYRFTLSQSLPPGEYALAEILEDSLNLYVWDFGVDSIAATRPTGNKQ